MDKDEPLLGLGGTYRAADDNRMKTGKNVNKQGPPGSRSKDERRIRREKRRQRSR